VREGRPDQAEPLYREAIEARGRGYPDASAGLGILLLRLDRREEAAARFDEALAEEPDLWAAMYGRARLLLHDGKVDEAQAFLQKGAKKRGLAQGEDRYHYGMALLHEARGDLAKAEPEALLAMHLNAADPEIGARAPHEARGEPALAIDAYERLLATPGTSATAPMLHALGNLYRRADRYNEARDRYLQAAEIDSTYAPVLSDLADVYRLAKQHDKAARIYLRYLAAAPDDVAARVHFAETAFELGQYDTAAGAAGEALARDSTRADARFALARAGVRSNDAAVRARAVEAFAALPDSLPWTAEDWTARATVEADAKNVEAARTSVTRALALDPALPAAHFQQGLLDLGAGMPDSASAAFERAIAGPGPLYHLNLGTRVSAEAASARRFPRSAAR
jgi:tetratricopeptide (TPR) repeat protein